jgi:glycosyltransferase involved in cell wall biosynthesis
MLEGFRRTATRKPLVVVGGATYADAFHQRVRSIAQRDPRIRLIGQICDQQTLKELWCNCYAYLHGHSVGGTNPALLRAMGYGCSVLALDTVFNREVLADTGGFFAPQAESVAGAIEALERDHATVERNRYDAPRRIHDRYSWERIVDQYEALFVDVASRGARNTDSVMASRSMT